MFVLVLDEFIDQACCLVEADTMSLATGSEGKSRGDALREAQLAMLKQQRRQQGVRPFHWGAFVLDGDWR